MTAPDEAKRLEDRGLDVIAGAPEEFAAHLANELRTVVKERGLRED